MGVGVPPIVSTPMEPSSAAHPPRHRSRPVRVGPLSFVVESNDEEVVTRFDHLFAGFDPADGSDGDALRVTVVNSALPGGDPNAADRYVSHEGDEALLASPDLAAHEVLVTRLLNDRKLDAEPDLLHLHGAAVSRGERAVVLLGRSGAGKSTVCAALVRAGWSYVTDEQVTIRPDDGQLVPYPRPITLRRPVWPMFSAVAEVPEPRPDDVEWARVEVSPVALGRVHRGPLRVAVLVVPTFEAGAGLEVVRAASAAEVVQWLASCCYDLDRLGLAGFELLVGLAARCPAWQMRIGASAPAVAAVADVLGAAAGVPALAVRPIAPSGSGPDAPPGTLRRLPSAHAWRFGDGSAVVFDPPTRKITWLDESGADLWEDLAEPIRAEALRAEDPAVAARLESWLQVMVSTGLVERHSA